LFHYGHDNLFKRCKTYTDKLIVGVSTDQLNKEKGKTSVNKLVKRLQDVKKNQYVNEVFVEEKLELKNEYINKYNADILIMGDDWLNKFDWVSCRTIYLPRTPNISTTILKSQLHK
jgi:glycerol-3-phosphate cytidylyltransferase